MKKLVLLSFLILSAFSLHAQFGVSVHQSNIPFVGFNYQIKDRLLPELRFGIDTEFEYVGIEATLSYIFIRSDDFNFYGGLGARTTILEGVVLPVGLNIYPFENKRFGFQMEVAALSGEENVLRGSWGIRYRFRKAGV